MNQIKCKDCICVPVCINKEWVNLLKCNYLQFHLATEGKDVESGTTVVVDIDDLRKKFIVTRDKKNEIYFGYIGSRNTAYWYVEYEGAKIVEPK